MPKIAVIGDSFIDRYWCGETHRLSPEAPLPVVNVGNKFDLPGGAANVRMNLRSLGADAVMLFRGLSQTQNYPIKNRLMVGNVQLARWDENDWCEPFRKEDLLAVIDCDAIIVADYGKGSISEEVIQILREVTIPVYVDTKRDPSPWLGSNAVMFPNLSEYRKFQNVYEWFPQVVLKCGADGLQLVQYGRMVLSRPALAREVVSVNGAGDTVIAAYADMSLSGGDQYACLDWANAAAGVVVGKSFTATPTVDEVEALYNTIH
jgi:bifunctional ADP-heptose synthase (sugar kinase/adenylyltransferase)